MICRPIYLGEKWLISRNCCLALPRPPIKLIAKELTSTSVRLVWSPASSAGAGRPSSSISPSYVVQYVEKSTDEAATGGSGAVREVTDIGATEYTVTGLRAHTQYEFRVIATNVLGRGTPSSPLDVTTAERGLQLSHLNFSSLI